VTDEPYDLIADAERGVEQAADVLAGITSASSLQERAQLTLAQEEAIRVAHGLLLHALDRLQDARALRDEAEAADRPEQVRPDPDQT
jgi:hypothetical protein